MSIKDLFNNPKGTKILSSEDFDKEVQKVESFENVQAKFREKERFIPNVDFSKPGNFARYGLAKDYYTDAIDRISREYPYDGTLRERTEFVNSSSYLDQYVLESRYPRTTGYVVLSAGGWGSLDGSITGEYGKPASVEYIKVLGGPNTASYGMPSGSLYQTFTGSNIYDAEIYSTEGILANGRLGSRESNLKFDPTRGVTVEFWMRKFDYAGAALTKKEVIFDLWNQNNTGSSTDPSHLTNQAYGRFTLELSASSGPPQGGADPFRLTIQSGSSEYGFYNQSISDSTVTTATITDKKWHHYAVSILTASTADNHGTEVKFYVDGKLNNKAIYGNMGVSHITGALVAHIGALADAPSGSTYNSLVGSMAGYGKLSASLDEFRFWKVARTDEQILNNYRYQVGGGTNNDIANTELGVYYKFNEGITGTSSVDSNVLDYSGRISNGKWTGYVGSNSRNTGSAIVSSSAGSEFQDPIIYSFHPDVQQLRSSLEATGSVYDHLNNASLYHSMPSWIVEDDTEGNQQLRKLSQVLSSYFDSLHLQIESLSGLKDATYLSSSFEPAKPAPFSNRLLTSKGFVAPELFADADLVAQVLARDADREYELDLTDIKNFIYKNIYNNLTGIYKAKGTEAAFRNLIRCFGIGDEIVKMKAYANNAIYKLENTHYMSAVPKKTINFNHPDHFTATVFQNSGTNDEQSSKVISGSSAFTSGYPERVDVPFTMECEVVFPKKLTPRNEAYFVTNFLSSSIAGWHRPLDSQVIAESFNTFHPDDYNLQLYAVKTKPNSEDAYFVLTGSNGNIGVEIETDVYPNVYNNEKWNFAIRTTRAKSAGGGGRVSGSAVGSIDGLIENTVVELIGLNYKGDILQESFHLSGNTNVTGAVDLLSNANKRFYVGADRTGFSGSVVTPTDVKVSQLRYYQSFLSKQAIHAHALDVFNYGTQNAFRNAYLDSTFADGMDIPEAETLALHWNFSDVTGSDSNGEFLVQDHSSGSVALHSRYGGLGKVTRNQHLGLGYGFKTSSTASVAVEYINTARQQLPEVVNSSDAISVLTNDDNFLTRTSAVSQFFYTFEKNMYDTVSQEMMNLLGTIAEYNNLIGEPVYRYRHEYKAMNKLRALFFERIGNTPDIDKYIEFYKWIDDSLSIMLRRLAPLSADVSSEVRTVIESHILERNKYQSKYPIVDTKGNRRFGVDDIEGTAKGVNELTYNWKFGHAPISHGVDAFTRTSIESKNATWWKERVKRNESVTVTSVGDDDGTGDRNLFKVTPAGHRPTGEGAGVDSGRETIRNQISRYDFRAGPMLNQIDDPGTVATYTGSTYAVNRFAKPYKIDAGIGRVIRSGHNTPGHAKDWGFLVNALAEPSDVSVNSAGGFRTHTTRRFRIGFGADLVSLGVAQTPLAKSQAYHEPDVGDILKPAIIDSDGKIIEKKRAHLTIMNQRGDKVLNSINAGAESYETLLQTKYVLPFSFISSSVGSGYKGQDDITGSGDAGGRSIFLENLGFDISGLHSEGIVDGAMQGPYTQRFVGGRQYRHQDLNFSGSDKAGAHLGGAMNPTGLDSAVTRAEGWKINATNDIFSFEGIVPKSTGEGKRAFLYRYPAAKRPLSVENIRLITDQRSLNGSTRMISGTLNSRMGNFTRANQVVFVGDRGTNNQAFVRNEGFNVGATASVYVEALVDYPKVNRGVAEHTMIERFSAPGGPETAGDSNGGPGLDFVTTQYSPYNNINFRNLSVRVPLKTMLSGVTNQFGFRSGIGEQTNTNLYSGFANFHKVNRNTRQRLEITNEFSLSSSGPGGYPIGHAPATIATSSHHDNYFVSRPIPQSDLAYAWITSSFLNTLELGYGREDGLSPSGLTHDGKRIHEASISFVSQSFVGSETTAAGARIAHGSVGKNEDNSLGFMPTLFGTMNTNIIDPVNTSSATLGNPFTTHLFDSSTDGFIRYYNCGPEGSFTAQDGEVVAGISRGSFIGIAAGSLTTLTKSRAGDMFILNQLNLFRNGPFGYPTWKQVRSSENGVTRFLKKNSKISHMIQTEEKISDTPTQDENHRFDANVRRARFGKVKNFVEPAVVAKHHPLEHNFVFTTKTKRGKNINKRVTVKSTFANAKVKFSNNELNNLAVFASEEPIVTAYDDVKDFYLDGALQDPDSPISKFIGLRYKEKVYPAENNTGLKKIRGRNNYDSKFWRSSRNDRTTTENTYSNLFSYEHSRWPLDASISFATTGSPGYAGEATSSAGFKPGILQNGAITQIYEFGKGTGGDTAFVNAALHDLKPGPLYSRFHLLSSTASVVSPTGMEIPEAAAEDTGNIWDGNSLLPGQYQFSGNFLTPGPVAFSEYHFGTALWQAPQQAGRVKVVDGIGKFVRESTEPFYDSYTEYAEDLRPLNKGMSVIPEFRISEHIDYYTSVGDFLAENEQFLSIEGASPDNEIPVNSTGSSFYKIFSLSDFMKHFKVLREDHEDIADPTRITLECNAVKKFLPYNGFYPAIRTVQISSQWSSSYSDFIDGGGADLDALSDESKQVLRSRPLQQAFFQPGILYNSIKSGIACDWACHTGSGKSFDSYTVQSGPPTLGTVETAFRRMHGTGSRGPRGWDLRVPFEALIEPEKYVANIPLVDMEVESDIARIQLTASWSGQGDNKYKMMVNNFLAESVRFFLKDERLTRISSLDESKFNTVTSGTTYTARVKIYRSMNKPRPLSGSWGDYPIPQDPAFELITGIGGGEHVNGRALGPSTGLRETFTMYSRPSAFGPPVAGFKQVTNGPIYDPAVFDSNQGYNPSYTPPYYNGEAWADIIYTADIDGKPTLDEIFSTAQVFCLRIDGQAFWSPGATGSTDNSNIEAAEFPMASGSANAYSMQMIHSFNMFGKAIKPAEKRRNNRATGDSDEAQDLDVWVIEPKWETPMLNFNTHGIAGERMLAGTDPTTNLIIPSASSGKGTVPRGMWHQFGVMPTASNVGVFMQVEDIPDNWVQNASRLFGIVGADGEVSQTSLPQNNGVNASNLPYNGAQSLVDLVGFKTGPIRLGEPAKSKVVGEAIVAIPFVLKDGDVRYFEIESETINKIIDNRDQGARDPDTKSIEDMIAKMQRYILPPKFDFLRNRSVQPISMYMFEFTHTFDQDDLSHMWQNLPPKVGRQAMKSRSTVSHGLLADALMGSSVSQDGTRMGDEVQWIVFKVKQRAEQDYFNITSKTIPKISERQAGLSRRQGKNARSQTIIQYDHEKNDSIPEYSYNWPYDFFSLIEFADLSAEVIFETPRVEDDREQKSGQIPQTPARDPDVGVTEDAETSTPEEEVTSSPNTKGPPRRRRNRRNRQQ